MRIYKIFQYELRYKMISIGSNKIDLCELDVIELKELIQLMKDPNTVDEIVFETEKEELLLESVCKVCPLIMSYVQSVLVIRECV